MILVLDSNRKNLELIDQLLSRGGYQVIKISNLEEADRIIEESSCIELALVDISGFGEAIWERCKRLHSLNIPFLIISPRYNPEIQRSGIKYGARGILPKPIIIKHFFRSIRDIIGANK
ncbi:MAG: response regulator [Syntrophobacterales bacterium]|nr:response regulator [Syntrophobacterales bacterium]